MPPNPFTQPAGALPAFPPASGQGPFRGELLSIEGLEAHARALAARLTLARRRRMADQQTVRS